MDLFGVFPGGVKLEGFLLWSWEGVVWGRAGEWRMRVWEGGNSIGLHSDL